MAELMSVTFKDVAVCFSEEEWNLLGECDKQLYKNVMLEIHGALLSLGYAIVNPDIVFRIKKTEGSYPMVQQPPKGREHDSYTTTGYPPINPDLLLTITRENVPCDRDHQLSEENKTRDGPATGHPVVTSAFPLKVKQEEELYRSSVQDYERTGTNNNPTSTHPIVTSVFSLRVKREEEGFCTDLRTFERGESISSSTSNQISPDVLCQIPQGEPAFMSRHVSGESAATKNQSTTGNWAVNRNVEEDEIMEQRRTFPEKSNDSLLQNGGMRFPIKGQISIKREMNITGHGQHKSADCGKSFHQWIAPIVQLEAHMQESPPAHNGCEKMDSKQSSWHIYQRTCRVELLHKCADCKKSFPEESKLIRHRRTHLGEKPYQCDQCSKLFRNKYCLLKHRRIHTGERPYKCTDCERSFTQDSSLIVHQRTHNGERPYKCHECERCFTCSSNLIRHRRTHMGPHSSRADP